MGTLPDPRRNPDLLKPYILGGTWDGPGILSRVAKDVEGMAAGYLPTGAMWPFISRGEGRGSIVGGTSRVGPSLLDVAKIYDLALAIDGWLGESRPNLVSYLRKEQISDVDYLVGSTRAGFGRLKRVRDRVHGWLNQTPVQTKHIDACLELIDILQDFSESGCDHHFRPIDGDFVRCDRCGLGHPDPTLPDGGRLRASTVLPQARCEGCGLPIYRDSHDARGRPRRWHSDACRKRAERSVA